MKIVAIRGKNLASLEGEFEIDFTREPLKSSGIFAITGHTGSGKSTLLDALCLALFDCTPRMNKAKESNVNVPDVQDRSISQNDSRSVLRRGTADGYAEVDFIALTGETFRSKWMVRRSRGKVEGSLQKVEMMLHNLSRGTEEQGTKTELLGRISELIGLSFEQFNRSVLLAQGDFATFLKARQTEKAEILEKLTGTEVYSRISASIYEKTKQAQAEYARLQERIKDIELLSDEQQAELNGEMQRIALNLSALKKEEERLSVWLKWIVDNDMLEQSKVQAEKDLQAVQEEMEQLKPRYEELKRIEYTQEVRDTFTELRNTQKQLGDTESSLSELKKVLSESVGRLSAARAREETAVKEQADFQVYYGRLEPQINKAKEQDVQLAERRKQFDGEKKEYDSFGGRRVQVEQAIKDGALQLDDYKKEEEGITVWFAEREKYAVLIPNVSLIVNLLSDWETSVKQKESNRQLSEHNKAALETEEKRQKELKAEAERLNKLLPTEIVELRKDLKEGVPCPVCGSVHHPLQYADKVQSLQEKELNQAKEEVAGAIGRQEIGIEKRKTDITRLSAVVENYERHISETLDSISTYVSILPGWEASLEQGKLKQQILNFGDQWKKQMEKQTDIKERLSRMQTRQESLKVERKGLEESEGSVKKKMEALQAELAGLTKERASLLDGKPTADVVNTCHQKQKEIEKELAEAREAHHKLSVDLESYKGRISQIEKEKSRLTLVEQEKTQELDVWLGRQELIGTKDELIRLLFKDAAWIAGEKKILDEVKERQTSLRAVLAERRQKLMEHRQSERKPEEGERKEELEARLTACRTDKEQQLARHTQIEMVLDNHRKGKQRIKDFEKELEEKTSVYEHWAKLNELFGSQTGNKFKEIAQGYTLDVLLVYANKHLKVLSKRYELQRIPDTLALQIADMDMMGEVRSVHSLSGGESFLISLALALGLSSLSSNRMNVESLFIDEGFGSLDMDTLRVAMDALERLQTQGRKIGVISHVAEMIERITTQIQVVRISGGKSRINIVG